MPDSTETLRRITPSVEWPITVCVLLYGDHPELGERFFSRLVRHTPLDLVRLRIGCNAISDSTRQIVAGYRERCFPGAMVIDSNQNLYKNPMMRRLFWDQPLETKWTIWFDDDSFVFRDDWLRSLALSIERHPDAAMFGKRYHIYPGEGERKFIESAPWFRDAPFKKGKRGDTPACLRIDFLEGGFWAIRTSVLRDLDWPDRGLLHHAEDYILGEALHQNQKRILQSNSGVAISAAIRRGSPEATHGFLQRSPSAESTN